MSARRGSQIELEIDREGGGDRQPYSLATFRERLGDGFEERVRSVVWSKLRRESETLESTPRLRVRYPVPGRPLLDASTKPSPGGRLINFTRRSWSSSTSGVRSFVDGVRIRTSP